jgi:hypothetical protein
MRKLVAGIVAVASLVIAAPAAAITNGQPDQSRHPEVGALLAQQAFSDVTWAECTGTLISSTVFLTAAHCDEGTSRVNVTFDSSYTHSTGATYPGTWHADPVFGKSQGDPHDIAVVVLDHAVSGISPASLPARNSLARLRKNQQFTSVGYGAQAVSSGKGGKTFTYGHPLRGDRHPELRHAERPEDLAERLHREWWHLLWGPGRPELPRGGVERDEDRGRDDDHR